MNTPTVEQVVNKLYEIRARKAELNKKIDELKSQEKRIDAWLLSTLDQNHLTKMGVDTTEGSVTIFVKEKTSVSVADWDEALEYVQKNAAWDLLYHQLSSKGVQEVFENGGTVPGVNMFRERVVGVQKR